MDLHYIYIYIYIDREMVYYGESDKMIKISRKLDKSNTYNGFTGNISFFYSQNFFRLNIFAFFYILSIE